MRELQDTLTTKTASVFGDEQQDRLMKLDFFLAMRGQGGLDKLGFTPPVMESIAKTAVFRPAVQDALEKVATQVYGPEFKVELSAELIGRLKTASDSPDKTYPFSRFLTNPHTTAATMGVPAGIAAALSAAQQRHGPNPVASGALAALLAGGAGFGLGHLSRAIDARALAGRQNLDDTWLKREGLVETSPEDTGKHSISRAITSPYIRGPQQALPREMYARALLGRLRKGEGLTVYEKKTFKESKGKEEHDKTANVHSLIKRACSTCGPCDPDKSWASQFAGTPLHDRALQADLEKEQLSLARDEKYLQEEIERGQLEHEEGILRVEKKRLELALAKMTPGVKRDYDKDWSDMFVGTPLHATALQLQVKDKELDLKRETNYVSRDERDRGYQQRQNANDVERSRLEYELAQLKLQQAQATGDVTKIAACQKTMAVAAVKHKGTVQKKVAAALLPTKAKIPIMVSMGALGAATSFAATKARAEDGSSRMEQYFKNMETKHPSGVINDVADKGQSMAKQLKKMPAVAALIGAGMGTALGVPAAGNLTKAAQLEKDAGRITEALKRIVGSQAGKNAIAGAEKKLVRPAFKAPAGAANMIRRAERGGIPEFSATRRVLRGV